MIYSAISDELLPILPQPEFGHDDTGAELRVMDMNGFALYQNTATNRLSEMFDPRSFKGAQGSTYADTSIESAFGVFAELGKIHGRYFGLDDNGVEAYMGIPRYEHRMRRAAPGLLEARSIDILFDQRKFDPIYFPKGNLLISMGVNLRALSDEQNAGVRLLTTQRYAGAGVETVAEILCDEDFCREHPDEAALISEILIFRLNQEELASSAKVLK